MGLAPLMVAAEHGNLTMIRKLIKSNCDINAVDRNGSTAVMLSVRCYLGYDKTDKARACIEYLMDANADMNIVDENGHNALMQYPEHWDEDTKEVVVSIIRHGCDVNHINNGGEYLLLQVIDTNFNRSAIQCLIQHGAMINGVGNSTYTPLVHILENRVREQKEFVEECVIFLNAGVDPDIGSPVVLATYERREDVVEMLLNYGADIDCLHESLGRVLLMGGYEENEQIVKIALKHNAKINISQVPLYKLPVLPDEANNNDAIMLMGAAGELFLFDKYTDEELPEQIVKSHDDLSLKNLCRKAIRNSVIANATHENMFDARTTMGLPMLLQEYLVFGMSISD